jgi:hypothetical protein
MTRRFNRRALTAFALIAGASLLQGCVYAPYPGYGYAAPYAAPAYAAPAYGYPAYGGGYGGAVVVGGGGGGWHGGGGGWGGDRR